jgi:16S rRNA (adenine1518-N6/adenine1519-N6)-dimethyltransferase
VRTEDDDVPRRPREVRRAIKDLGLKPSRGRGQNFLVDASIPGRIARACGCGPGDFVLEVGPGFGTLTAALLDAGARVLAVELDERLAQRLAETLGSRPGLAILQSDALDGAGGLSTAMVEAVRASLPPDGRWFVAANLPYSVATPLVQALADFDPPPLRMTLMVQREVGDRLRAAPGTPAYGVLSVTVQDVARVAMEFRVPSTAFRPAPDVQSAVIRLEPRADRSRGAARAALVTVARAAFAQRRKTLGSVLRSAGLADAAAVAALGIDPGRRGESLSVEEFRVLAALAPAPPGGDTGAP